MERAANDQSLEFLLNAEDILKANPNNSLLADLHHILANVYKLKGMDAKSDESKEIESKAKEKCKNSPMNVFRQMDMQMNNLMGRMRMV